MYCKLCYYGAHCSRSRILLTTCIIFPHMSQHVISTSVPALDLSLLFAFSKKILIHQFLLVILHIFELIIPLAGEVFITLASKFLSASSPSLADNDLKFEYSIHPLLVLCKFCVTNTKQSHEQLVIFVNNLLSNTFSPVTNG